MLRKQVRYLFSLILAICVSICLVIRLHSWTVIPLPYSISTFPCSPNLFLSSLCRILLFSPSLSHLSFSLPSHTLNLFLLLFSLQDIWSRGRFGSYKYEVANQDHSCLIGTYNTARAHHIFFMSTIIHKLCFSLFCSLTVLFHTLFFFLSFSLSPSLSTSSRSLPLFDMNKMYLIFMFECCHLCLFTCAGVEAVDNMLFGTKEFTLVYPSLVSVRTLRTTHNNILAICFLSLR